MSHYFAKPARLMATAILVSAVGAARVHAQDAASNAAPVDLQIIADGIGKDVAEILGLPFRQPVAVETQSADQYAEYIARRIDKQVPKAVRSHYGKIVKTLGLYRGPEIDDYSAMMTSVMVSQAGAYYDLDKQRFYVLMNKMPDLIRDALYSHELYHALQDQYFGLARYLNLDHDDPSLNADQMLARAAVVEGEATYMMTVYALENAMKKPPPREVLARAVGMQATMSVDQLRVMVQQPRLAEFIGEDLRNAARSTEKVPPFILDAMIGVYLKGMGFVFAVQEHG